MRKNKSDSIVFLVSSLFFSLCITITVSYSPDLIALQSFRSSSDPSHSLSNWDSGDPCSGKWVGVSCKNQRVTRLVLQNMNLSGSLQPLTGLDQLRVLSLKKNAFHTALPDFTSWRNMKLLYLSHNRFSSDLPVGISTLRKLRRLDLSYNELTGRVPEDLTRLSNLLTLRLEHNQLSGNLQIFAYRSMTTLEDFNVSSNRLAGAVPAPLSGFPVSSFDGNPSLCGRPLPNKCVLPKPVSELPLPSYRGRTEEKRAVGKVAAIAISVADLCALGFITWILLYCCCWPRVKENKWKKRREESRTTAYWNSDFQGNSRTGDGKEERMVFFDGRNRFRLEDLLKASAEMLGKGSLGSTYKATFHDGNVVVVKRLRERASGGGKKSVEHQMEVLGGIRHSNLVSLIAYYKSKEEMLLIYDYFNNGSLHSLLHGNRGPGRMPLDWTTRLKLALDSARGLSFLHHSCKSKLFHGNLTAHNILIDRDGNARLSDISLLQFIALPAAAMNCSATPYKAPEQIHGVKRPSQRSDVYSFGIILLEILTGKSPMEGNVCLPKWVQSVVKEEWTAEVFDLELLRYKEMEGEMVSLLQIAFSGVARNLSKCLCEIPHQRPKMSHVVTMIIDIRGANDDAGTCSSIMNGNSSESSPSISGETGTTNTTYY